VGLYSLIILFPLYKRFKERNFALLFAIVVSMVLYTIWVGGGGLPGRFQISPTSIRLDDDSGSCRHLRFSRLEVSESF